MAMDNTTLHTFLFHCPAALRSVVLLGSWDNFSRPYPLQIDVRGGRNLWKGCFTFSDIICDGDLDQQAPKRDGPLKMGGTYWYFYKVDEDEECHNPSEESTTFCPLLPGQRLNVLDVPREGHSRSISDTSSAFTRDPKDRYLTPVPPASQRPLPSPRTRSSEESHVMPLPSPWTPKSATHPPTDGFLSTHVARHARSASASPYMPSTPIFPDFKLLKEKLASKRSASRNRSGSKTRELDISAPVLVSGGEELNLIPLSVYRPSFESIREAETAAPRSVPTIRREFSPLASHPVDPDHDSLFGPAELPTVDERLIRRRRSHVPSTVITSEFKVEQSRVRANSADTRRTQHYLFSNDPWLSSPKLQQEFEAKNRVVEDDTPSAPVLSRPSTFLGAPVSNERPISSHGSIHSTNLRQSPFDKELPALPRYLIPAPLYAYNDVTIGELPANEPEDEFEEADDNERLDHFSVKFHEKARSHFSTWSNDSISYNSPTSSNEDDEGVFSPTFSSLTSNDSDVEIPQGLSIRYSYASLQQVHTEASKHVFTVPEIQATDNNYNYSDTSSNDDEKDDRQSFYRLSTPPQLNELRISTFGSDLFKVETTEQHSDAASSRRASRRQAACFGLGFQYSLPEEDVGSKTTIEESVGRSERLEPTLSVRREREMSGVHALMEDFAFLGDAVI
ncbi:hypothetical protein G6011_10270 [Alternaria panax]|uniref:Uncharacterized protein n=1 Tax=Alternaria panax TaxID=48097 RepID=A0AAD4IBI7_9PLEO|nr:hypothetical protein G6011_10270 [Alternaria panax]